MYIYIYIYITCSRLGLGLGLGLMLRLLGKTIFLHVVVTGEWRKENVHKWCMQQLSKLWREFGVLGRRLYLFDMLTFFFIVFIGALCYFLA